MQKVGARIVLAIAILLLTTVQDQGSLPSKSQVFSSAKCEISIPAGCLTAMVVACEVSSRPAAIVVTDAPLPRATRSAWG
jgi:hypothetical protein